MTGPSPLSEIILTVPLFGATFEDPKAPRGSGGFEKDFSFKHAFLISVLFSGINFDGNGGGKLYYSSKTIEMLGL